MMTTTNLSKATDGEAKRLNDAISATAFDGINFENSSSGGKNQGIPLKEWLQNRQPRSVHNIRQSVAKDATLKEWLQLAQNQNQQPLLTPDQCLKEKDDLLERLRVAIATTAALSNFREENKGAGCHISIPFSLDSIILHISDEYCNATLDILENRDISAGEKSHDEVLKQLGHVLNAIFDGGASMGIQPDSLKKVDDRRTKKRGKSQQSVESLPLYLTCLISSLIATADPGDTMGQYESVKQVLQDLQAASNKPQVYLKNTSWDDVKNSRLHIPRDSFYGRKSELSLVLHSLDTVLRFGQPVMVSVSGYAGTGKTTLLNQIKGPLKEAGGWLIRGKFDKKIASNTVIFSALDAFFDVINRGDAKLQAELKLRITASVGCGVQLLLSVIPNLRTLLEGDEFNGEGDYDIEETTVSHQRWRYLLCRLIKAIRHPVAFYLDDLHWCDEVTLDMIQTVVLDPEIRHCLFLVSYRLNAQEQAVTRTLDTIQTQGVRLVSLKLSCIERESVNSLTSEILCMPPCLCQPLSAIVHSKTGGLILFAVDLLKSLHEEGMIRFNLNTRQWQYSLNKIRQRKIPTDVVEHLSERMTRLPNNVQSLLKIAACLGRAFDVDLLQLAIQGNKVTMIELLPFAIESGFLQEIPSSNNIPRIAFSHDQVHLAAYNLIPLSKRQSSHLLIGSRIYMNITSEDQLYKVIFDLVNNMNTGLKLITSQSQRDEVAQLNLTAGQKAMESSSFKSAAEYYMIGIEFLAGDCWESNYKPSLILHQSASEALFVSGDFVQLKNVIDTQLCHAKCLDDKLYAYYCLVRCLHALSNVKEAMETTLSILEELGETFPSLSEITPEFVYKELILTKAQLDGLTKQDICKAPRLSDERKLWTMRFMNHLMKYLFSAKPIAMPLVACRMIAISLKLGYCCDSAMGFSTYGLAALNILHDEEEAYRWAKMSLSFPEMFNAQSSLPKLSCLFHMFISWLKQPLQASSDELLNTHQDLLIVGDAEVAVAALCGYCRQILFTGNDLATVNQSCMLASTKMAEHSQFQNGLSHTSHHLVILKLRDDAGKQNPFDVFSECFNGEVQNEDDLLQHAKETGKVGVVQAIHFNRFFLAYWLKRYEEAAKMAELYHSRKHMPLIDAQHAFYQGLTAFHFARQHSDEPKWMSIGEKALSSYETWKSHSTWNWENKLLLLEGEYHWSKGELDMAEKKYTLAIESARNHRFVHEEGLGNELMSAFYSANGNVDKATHHISEARACYEKWGAFACVYLLDCHDDKQ